MDDMLTPRETKQARRFMRSRGVDWACDRWKLWLPAGRDIRPIEDICVDGAGIVAYFYMQGKRTFRSLPDFSHRVLFSRLSREGETYTRCLY